MLIGEIAVKVDHDMQTTIPLFAIGDASYGPPLRRRSAPPEKTAVRHTERRLRRNHVLRRGPKTGAGDSAARLRQADRGLRKAPVRASGEGSGCKSKVMRVIHKAVGPMERSVYMSGHRIETAMRYVERRRACRRAQSGRFPRAAQRPRGRGRGVVGEMQFRLPRCARSRAVGSYARLSRDGQQNWLKWIIVKNKTARWH